MTSMSQLYFPSTPPAARLSLFDNLKALLILLVVFGHTLEGLTDRNGQAQFLYLMIYSFHMPLFAFCSGYFASYRVSRIKRALLYPFFLFQTLYLLFDRLYLGKNTAATFTKPYWLMWYLFALIVWEVALPFLETGSKRTQLFFIGASFALGLLAGYDEKIGYYMSLSRIIVYFPFFLMAHYMRVNNLYREIIGFARSGTARGLSFLSAAGMTLCIIWRQDLYKASWLYGSRSYEAGSYSALERLQFLLFALLWITFLLGLMPERRTFLSGIGRNSMYVYLLHGFLIKILEHEKFFSYIPEDYVIPAAFLLSVSLVFLLSREFTARLFRPLVRFG